MSFFGIKEPIDSTTKDKTWTTVSTAALYNSTQITLSGTSCPPGIDGKTVYDESCVVVYKNGFLINGDGKWSSLESETEAASGWRQDFSHSYERVLGQASVLGGTVLFTSYTPSEDLCEFEGSSSLWALYYKTGTAYYKPILTSGTDTFATSLDLGRGLAITPNIHVGEKPGSTAFIQTSTGAIETVEIANPITVKSGPLFWEQRR